MKTCILGISAYYHDSSACILIDNKITAAAQEERFSRIKNDSSFPVLSIEYCLKEANLQLFQVNYIVFYEKPFLKFERILDTIILNSPLGYSFYLNSIPKWVKKKIFMKINIVKELKKIDVKWDKTVFFSEHHLSHMASAFYPSPFEKSLILTIDGVGEWATTAIGIGDKNQISIKETIKYPHSIGLLYSAFTQYLGFKVNSGEYKVMGLAPYGSPIYENIIKSNLIQINSDGSFKLNMKYFSYSKKLSMINSAFIGLFNVNSRKPESEISQFHFDIAASIQKVIEDVVILIVNYMSNKYSLNILTMAGGVALNCVSNSKIIEKTRIKHIWIQPASGDAGGSLGAALAFQYLYLNKDRIIEKEQMQGTYLGPSFQPTEIEKIIKKNNFSYKHLNQVELVNLIAREIDNEKIIGWFQGRMEFGPRSLGNRAILGKANSQKSQKNINLKIKFRESFRPFAPSILKDKVLDYFKPLGAFTDIDSPYMLFTYQIKDSMKISSKNKTSVGLNLLDDKRSEIQAVTHVDYSSRVQTVTETSNKLYYNLIKAVGASSSHPIIVNTSFNVRGEPIVCSPQDAINCFVKTEIDILVIGDFVIIKSPQAIL